MQPTRTSPLLWILDDLLSEEDVTGLLEALAPERLAAAGTALEARDGGPAVGQTAEVPVASHPALDTLAARLTRLVGLENRVGATFRVRAATAGDSHPLHLDEYVIDGAMLAVTALVFLTDCEGGPTRFPHAEPPLHVAPKAGRVVVWVNLTPDGGTDPTTRHAVGPVMGGKRVTLNWFVYATPAEVAAAAAGGTGALIEAFSPSPALTGDRTLTCVIDSGTPSTTRDSLRRGCASRGVRYVEVSGGSVDPREPPLEPGALLYRPATTWAAMRAERQLWQPGVSTFYRSEAGPFVVHTEQWMALARAGLPTPASLRLGRTDDAFLREAVEALGGLPLIVRLDDGEGGVGVLRADSFAALRSLAELLVSRGHAARLAAFVPDAMHWRLVVVGERVVAAYRNPVRHDDFRSEPSGSPDDYGLTPPADMAALAVRASHVAGSAFAGVDVLEHPSGRLYVLEANSPCYFPQAETWGKADVAGAMVDHLIGVATTHYSLAEGK